jgi:hypothetical protein
MTTELCDTPQIEMGQVVMLLTCSVFEFGLVLPTYWQKFSVCFLFPSRKILVCDSYIESHENSKEQCLAPMASQSLAGIPDFTALVLQSS